MIRKSILALIVLIGLATIGILVIGNPRGMSQYRQHIKSCFSDGQGLRDGAAVRISGVEVGRVQRVKVDPQRKDCLVEVTMDLATPYEIRIPKDSTVELGTAGVLGETYVGIDSRLALGEPIENYGYLKGKPGSPNPSIEDLIKHLTTTLGSAKALEDCLDRTPKPTTAPLPPPPQGKHKSRPARFESP